MWHRSKKHLLCTYCSKLFQDDAASHFEFTRHFKDIAGLCNSIKESRRLLCFGAKASTTEGEDLLKSGCWFLSVGNTSFSQRPLWFVTTFIGASLYYKSCPIPSYFLQIWELPFSCTRSVSSFGLQSMSEWYS